MLLLFCQPSPNKNADFVFHEGPAAGPPGQKGEKGDVGLPGVAVQLPSSSTKGNFQ